MKPKKIIGIILIVIVFIFGLQNMNVGTINLLFWKLEMPAIFLIFFRNDPVTITDFHSTKRKYHLFPAVQHNSEHK